MDGDIPNLNLGELDLTTDEFILDEVDSRATFTLKESYWDWYKYSLKRVSHVFTTERNTLL